MTKIVIPSIQLLLNNDDTAELQIRLGALDLRIELTMREFMQLMLCRVVNPKARFRPVTGEVSKFKERRGIITLDADTLTMPTLESGRYVTAEERLGE
jgi:hypothetical protein